MASSMASHLLPLLYFLLLPCRLQSQGTPTSCSTGEDCKPHSDETSFQARSLLQRSTGRVGASDMTIPGFTSAKDALPPELLALGEKLFGSQQALDKVVEQSTCAPMVYANVSMQICTADGDDASKRLPGEDGIGYGLDSLDSLLHKPGKSMINVVDMGGNYGVVTIAIFKKYPGKVRAVTAEPVPPTYFFLRWNMHLNGVPVVDENAFKSNGKASVAALQKGVSGSGDSVLRICCPPWSTMNAYPSSDPNACKCNEEGTICHEVQSVASNDMLNMFGSEDITFLKLDCEGCEKTSLPAIANTGATARVKRLVGELHDPDPDLVQLACKHDNGTFLTAICRGGVGRVDGPDACSKCNVW